METVNRHDFEEALREDGIQQPDAPKLHGLIDATEKDMNRLINSSASDCQSTLDCQLANDPAGTLRRVTSVLHLMNFRDIEKKSHRAALLRAGRKALNQIGEYHP